ncbi:hypothetical protein PENTCL1PPCAC_7489 [Pristionchus entomophagus]|uniref:FXNA-like protease n=1 Tax=Pristionchus entomophagus TaxID=358040 RepID=A0AAV5SYG8_9BILA|nr:hypothetical protein PENTCL1PPCAC_7489 [Pristionchus entomophagus]
MASGLRQRHLASGGATSANGDTTEYGRLHDEEEKKPSLLGFRHWLFALAVIAIVYGGVVYCHQRLPDVKPAGDYSEFSEDRARGLLKQIVALGPRPSGSAALEKRAMPLLQRRLESAKEAAETVGKNRVEIDTQHPTGCFDLKFLSAFTLCYHNVTNKIARIGPAKGPAAHSLLLNCHIDTMPDTPGATDDAVSCTIMMDILDVLAREEKELQYDVVFLFNGAEENFLQGAHGFIEAHPWRHTIRAFINLEGTGSGGREILFQAGPGNSWLLQAYLDAAPHPYCSILAQEVFQSGIIPSDTDFRIFRDFGRVSGLDIAYTRNGWVYHTEFDTEERIDAGSIQRAGENVLAVVRKVLNEEDLSKPGKAAEQNKWVFYDVVGLFTVRYTVELGVVLNVGTSILTLFFTFLRIRKGTYGGGDLLVVFFRHILSLLAMAVVGGIIAVAINAMDLVMCWYSLPELIGGLYVLPMVLAGLYVHELFHAKQYMRNAEMAHFDSVMVLLAAALLWMTHAGLASAFFLLNYLLFAMLRDPILFVMGRVGVIRTVTPRSILAVQMLSLIPAMIFAAYAISQCVDFFVPVIGRLGMAVNPEAIMAPLGLVIAFTFVLFTNNLVYVSRPLKHGFRVTFLLFCGLLIALATTNLGVPYKYSEDAPRLRRLIALHSHRTVYSFEGQRESAENALFIQSFDYRSTSDLPAHSFLSGSPPSDCHNTKDEYCRLPYYTAIHELFPPSHSLWVAVPASPSIPHPIQTKLISRERVGNTKLLNMTFELDGGYDKMSLHVTALNGFELKSWSFTPLDIQQVDKRDTYFVFLTYGSETPPTRKFWFLLEQTGDSFPDVSKKASLELAVASHHAHGEFQNSETLRQLRSLIASRRQSTHFAVGWWKWGITLIAGVSEIVVKQF